MKVILDLERIKSAGTVSDANDVYMEQLLSPTSNVMMEVLALVYPTQDPELFETLTLNVKYAMLFCMVDSLLHGPAVVE